MFSGCPSVRVRVRACVRVEAFSDRFAVDIYSYCIFSISACAFYRAMLCIRGTSHGPVSVSVCLSVSVCHMSEFY